MVTGGLDEIIATAPPHTNCGVTGKSQNHSLHVLLPPRNCVSVWPYWRFLFSFLPFFFDDLSILYWFSLLLEVFHWTNLQAFQRNAHINTE